MPDRDKPVKADNDNANKALSSDPKVKEQTHTAEVDNYPSSSEALPAKASPEATPEHQDDSA